MTRPTLLPAALVLAAGVAPAAAFAGDVPADGEEAVVRLSAPATPIAEAGDDAVVVRAQNRAGRGYNKAKKVVRRPVRRRPAPARRPRPAPAPAPAVRPVSGEVAPPAPTISHGPAVPQRPVLSEGQIIHGGETTTCPQCNGQCQPGVPCPCLGHGLFAPGGYFNRGGVWSPRHVHNYSYDAPRNLAYPPNANPAVPGQMGPMPVVQYPYYTTKGPDDFFHDRDGEF